MDRPGLLPSNKNYTEIFSKHFPNFKINYSSITNLDEASEQLQKCMKRLKVVNDVLKAIIIIKPKEEDDKPHIYHKNDDGVINETDIFDIQKRIDKFNIGPIFSKYEEVSAFIESKFNCQTFADLRDILPTADFKNKKLFFSLFHEFQKELFKTNHLIGINMENQISGTLEFSADYNVDIIEFCDSDNFVAIRWAEHSLFYIFHGLRFATNYMYRFFRFSSTNESLEKVLNYVCAYSESVE